MRLKYCKKIKKLFSTAIQNINTYDDVNLKAMVEMGKIFNLNYGYSDHTSGIEVPITAGALGASVIEKHFTIEQIFAWS